MATGEVPDVVILDLGLPDLDGHEVLRRLREWFRGPIIILSARDQDQQKIKALESGADDYVTNPFGTGELVARMRTAMLRTNHTGPELTAIAIGDVRIDLAARLVYRRGAEVHLTSLEYKLLAVLITNAGKVLTHRFLLKEVWGPQNS
jgi:two-component system KDP operon response regulator KdpE